GGDARAVPRAARGDRGAGTGRGRRRLRARQPLAAVARRERPTRAAGTLARSGGPLAIDFGVPPNVDPDEARRAGISRIGMSELVEAVQERRVSELLRLAPVRAAIDERLARLREEMATRAIGPRLAELRGAFERIAADEL